MRGIELRVSYSLLLVSAKAQLANSLDAVSSRSTRAGLIRSVPIKFYQSFARRPSL
jgi:hypothetical protein